jgi:hypothetical protein
MTIINDDSGVVNKLEDSLTVDSRVVIYDRHMFIVQAKSVNVIQLFSSSMRLMAQCCITFYFCNLQVFVMIWSVYP